jgi:PAS domain S-box-containing protein
MLSGKKIGDLSQEQHTFTNFTIMYAVALTLIAIISIVSQILIQRYLSNQVDDSHVINFAARLRTYSQTLSKTALLIESGRDLETNRKDFVTTLKQWEKSNKGLRSGSDFLSLPVNDRDELEQMFGIINGPYEEILDASNKMIQEMYRSEPFDSMDVRPYVKKILEYEKSYLLGMELIVFDYDRFSRESVRRLKTIEYFLLAVVIFSLLMEVLFIFYPLSVRIRQIMRGLMDSDLKSKELALQVQEASQTLERSHRELREINFALEKATYLVKTDRYGKIIYANDKYCHVTKYTMSELRGKPLFYNNMGGNESIIYEHINDPHRNTEVWQGEVFDHASDGTGFWLDVSLMPIIDNRSELYQYLVICTDVTKRKNTERELWLLTEEKMRRQDVEQKIKSYSIINGQEKERKRIAAEIHDGIGQMLTSLRMKMEQIEDLNPQLNGQVAQVNGLLYSIINETKRICSDLLPSVLDDFGLRAAINELLKMCKDSVSGIEFELVENIRDNYLPKEVEIGAFRILQEALNNAIKHSGANQITVHVDNDGEYLNLIVQDNGKGFYFEKQNMLSREFASKANGLRNMKERAELLGGQLTVTSESGQGTIVQLEIPV